jgi:hypothetical protein
MEKMLCLWDQLSLANAPILLMLCCQVHHVKIKENKKINRIFYVNECVGIHSKLT